MQGTQSSYPIYHGHHSPRSQSPHIPLARRFTVASCSIQPPQGSRRWFEFPLDGTIGHVNGPGNCSAYAGITRLRFNPLGGDQLDAHLTQGVTLIRLSLRACDMQCDRLDLLAVASQSEPQTSLNVLAHRIVKFNIRTINCNPHDPISRIAKELPPRYSPGPSVLLTAGSLFSHAKFSDRRERVSAVRAVARGWLAALPPCLSSFTFYSRLSMPTDALMPGTGLPTSGAPRR